MQVLTQIKGLCIAHLDHLEIAKVDKGTKNGGQQGRDTSGHTTNCQVCSAVAPIE